MTNGNSKFNIEALKTLGLIIGLLVIIAQGLMSSGSKDALNERVARLEECVMSLRPLPQEDTTDLYGVILAATAQAAKADGKDDAVAGAADHLLDDLLGYHR